MSDQPDNASALLPCPFCGTTALIDRDVSHDDDGYYEISCTNCTGSSDRFIGVHAASRAEAVDFWNTRTPAQCGVQSDDAAAHLTAELLRIKNRFDTIFNNVLCDMQPGWDDSIVGFNKAWGVASDIFQEEIGRATASALLLQERQ